MIRILNNSQELIIRNVANSFYDIYCIDNTNTQDYIFSSRYNGLFKLKKNTFRNEIFRENPTALKLLRKISPDANIIVRHGFFLPNYLKAKTTEFHNTLTFDQYLFNSWINIHLNLFYWKSLHPLYLLFQGECHIFQVKQPTPSESCVLCGFFQPQGGVQNIPKVKQKLCQHSGSQTYILSCKAS